jgi:tRNA (guanine-N7-)-methyltransferase
MSRKKLEHYYELKKFPHVFEMPLEQVTWAERLGNKKPITLELACGGGEYTTGLAELYPDRNFIGIDIKGGRLWHGAIRAIEKKLDNAFFLRLQIEFLSKYFGEGEVDEIWITFADPRERKSEIKKRLTAPRFFEMYKKILIPGGKIHLKTDHEGLFDYTLQQIKDEKAKLLYAKRYLFRRNHESGAIN